MRLRIPSWARFQHYRDRSPPWIKLHRSVLDDRDMFRLTDQQWRVLVGLWLYCAEKGDKDGTFAFDAEDVAFRLRHIEPGELLAVVQSLVGTPLLEDCTHDASKTIDREEKRREEKRAADTRPDSKRPSSDGAPLARRKQSDSARRAFGASLRKLKNGE